ncbi:tetratricopeptide repeat protein [Nitrospira sp. KM1]|uniref:tetratricopeptide repeat protein n=1 Tax=Nitrospira sp. KM1 TaxID=1936990 RepID=UPI0015631AF4|nr:tetratricopeptide repeat protein [Nitrospira sp. KM1]
MDRLILHRLAFFALAASATVATYAGAVYGDFQFDDVPAILENPHLERWETFLGHLGHMVRPALYGTLLIDRSLYGTGPTGYHVLNLLLHLGSGLLIYRILSHAVTEDIRQPAFWTALLFLIHPIQTEAVTYISGRASGLMAFFYLLALTLYLEAATHRRNSISSRRYLIGALISFMLALGSKETAMTFPFVLLLWDPLIRRLDHAELRRTFLSSHLPFWLVLFAAGLWTWSHPRYSALAQFSFGLRPFWDNLLSELHAAVYALLLLVCPWKQNFDHDLPVLHSLSEWPMPIDMLLLSGMAGGALIAARRLPLFSFGLAWFFLQMLPTILIPRNDLLSERNLYLASMGPFLAVVALGIHLISRLIVTLPYLKLVRVAAGSLIIALVVTLCLVTVQRNALYRDPLLLWSDTVAKSPRKARPHNNLGHSLAQRGDWSRAIDEFRIAATLDPDYVAAQDNLRDAYLHHVGRR